MRTAICAAIIEDKKILLVRKKKSWMLPGGKPNPKEPDIECLCREVAEELSGTLLDSIRYYGQFDGITPHKGDTLKAKVYFASINGNLHKPSAEIESSEWIGTKDITKYDLSDITLKIINSLKEDNYL